MYRCKTLFFALLNLLLALSLWAASEEAGRNPNDPLDQGGETCAQAVAITTIPYCDFGSTAGRVNDYPVPCNTGSAAPDVVYTMTPPVTAVLSFSLCGSGYNSALTIWRGCPSQGGVIICCSDNVCGDDACCTNVTLLPNVQYFIVVDGGAGGVTSGNYTLNVVTGDACPNTPCAGDTCRFPSLDVEPLNNNCTANAPFLTCPDTVCGTIAVTADRDWYSFAVTTQCASVNIAVYGNDTPGHYPSGRGLNPKVSIYQNDCATLIAQDDDGGVGLDALIDSLCLPQGNYKILVESVASMGPYELWTWCGPCNCTCPYPNGDIEPNNICTGGGEVLTCGDTLCGNITPGIDGQDYYYLDIFGPGCQNVTIDVFGNDTPGQFPFGQGLNPQISLISITCDSTIMNDQNSGIGNDARIDSLCLPPGLYRIYVAGQPLGQSFGPYVITMNCTPCECPTCPYPNQDLEPNDVCAGGGAVIACGDTTCGEITPSGDNDYYYLRVLGQTCQLVTIDVFGNDTPGWFPFGQGLNPLVALYSGVCDSVVGFDDTSGVGNDARIQVCLEPGTYRLLVRSPQNPFTVGPYILATSCTPCECPEGCPYPNRDNEGVNNTCGTFNPPTVCGDTLCGDLTSPTDNVDWYLFTVVGPGLIRVKIDVFADDTPGWYPFGMGLDPMVRIIGAGCTTILGVDTAGGTGEDAHLEVCLPQGSYNIQVQQEDFTSGPYILATHCEPCDTCPYPSFDIEPINDDCGTFNHILHCGDVVCGEIDGGDTDWYVLQITECTQLFIDVLGDDTPGFYPFGQGLNPAVELFNAACSGGLYGDQNSGVGEDAQLTTGCLEPGIYMLHVVPEFGTQGPYILFIGCEQCPCDAPCVVECPDTANFENELCPSFPDTFNCGCDNQPPRFLPLFCNDAYCGTSYSYLSFVDSDWYLLRVGDPSQVRICVNSEFDGYLSIFEPGGGLNPCNQRDLIECLPIAGCQGGQCISVCLREGIYLVEFTPTGLEPVNCWDYVLWTACSPCEPLVCPAPDSLVIHYPDTVLASDPETDIVLHWEAIPAATEYRIYRSSDNNSPVIVTPANYVGSTTNTYFVHGNVIAFGGNEIWIYQIVAYCGTGAIPCDEIPAAIRPEEPRVITPRE